MQLIHIVQLGLAIFAMLFGAGNVVFPLSLGCDSGTKVFFAIAGFILTGVIVPLIGLVSAALFNGDYRKFLGMAGRWPGAIIAFMCMLLVGPFGATPRCITLAHGAVYWHLPAVSLFVFSIVTALLIFAATVRKGVVVEMMGRFFGPIKLVLLFTVIVLGILSAATPLVTNVSGLSAFTRGFADGYQTLDLIGTIFFSGLIIASLRSYMHKSDKDNPRVLAMYCLKAGTIGCSLLALVYLGFSFAAAKHGFALAGVEKTQLLSALAAILLGEHASVLANITTVIACLSTAIALTAIFADYVAHDLLCGKVKYMYTLIGTVFLNFVMTNMGFSGIAHVIEPVVMVCYPALIVLSLASAAHVLWGFNYVKQVVLITFSLNICLSVYNHLDAITACLPCLIG
jgi:LIVCS family branched-chain amino acid:cation transporter